MSADRQSILGQVRAEGYKQGWSQASELQGDHTFERGRIQGLYEESFHHKRWWFRGLLSGAGAYAILDFFL